MDPAQGADVAACLQDRLSGYFTRVVAEVENRRIRFVDDQGVDRAVPVAYHSLTATGLDARRGTEPEVLPQLHWYIPAMV